MKRVLSYGGGLDSWAMLLLAVQRGEHIDAVVFIDVADGTPDQAGKDPGEWAGTYRHIREIVMPLCARHDIRFEWIDTVRYPVRDAKSLFTWLWDRHQIPIAKKSQRVCTVIAKVERFERWLKDAFPGEPVEVWIGFEAGEEDRIAKDPNAGKNGPQRRNRFPLHEAGLCRCRCLELARRSGYPVPRKSACVFCPFASRADWKTLAAEQPADFARVVELEARKPPTKENGFKLSIMNYRTVDRPDGTREARPELLPEFVKNPGRPKPPPSCGVCGAAVKATKATGCGWLEGDERPAPSSAVVATAPRKRGVACVCADCGHQQEGSLEDRCGSCSSSRTVLASVYAEALGPRWHALSFGGAS